MVSDQAGTNCTIDVAYEDVIADAEAERRALLDRLGLPSDPTCFRFHENEADAVTAGAGQKNVLFLFDLD